MTVDKKTPKATVGHILTAFNSQAAKAVKFDNGEAMAALAEDKSAYGRALRDITVVALSGRWRDAKSGFVSDNQIEARMGVPVRHPRFRLKALTLSGLVFRTNADITDNADVWAHVARMYNAGKAGRDLITKTSETIKAITDTGDKRAAWLAVPVPAREVTKRAAQPPTGVTKDKTPVTPDVTPDVDADKGELIVPENAPLIPNVKALDTSDLLSLFHDIGDALTGRLGSLEDAERMAFRENVLLFMQATAPKSGVKTGTVKVAKRGAVKAAA